MRKLIDNESIDDPVKQFLTGLEISNEASVVELNGRRVYLFVRPAKENGALDEPWTDEKFSRRYELIKRRLNAIITPLEAVELAELEEQFDCHMMKIAPLPLEYAHEILAQIQSKMGRGNGAS